MGVSRKTKTEEFFRFWPSNVSRTISQDCLHYCRDGSHKTGLLRDEEGGGGVTNIPLSQYSHNRIQTDGI